MYISKRMCPIQLIVPMVLTKLIAKRRFCKSLIYELGQLRFSELNSIESTESIEFVED